MGNTVVWKPSLKTPLTAIAMTKLCAEVLGAEWAPLVSLVIDISTRPMSDSRSLPWQRYAFHCTFTVSAMFSRSMGKSAL